MQERYRSMVTMFACMASVAMVHFAWSMPPAGPMPAITTDAPWARPAIDSHDEDDGDHASSKPLDRLAFIGASVTHGYGVTLGDARLNLSEVFTAALPSPPTSLESVSSLLFFRNAHMTGKRAVDRALRIDPTTVIALDFLFWYGYGDASQRTEDALASLEKGLKELERFECPVVVGNFPDMSPAVGIMISPFQMPSKATLEALNERVETWVNAREQAYLVDLATLVEEGRAGGPVTIGSLQWTDAEAAQFLQDDQLHTTLKGTIALVQLIGVALMEGNDAIDASMITMDATSIASRLEERFSTPAGESSRQEPPGEPRRN